VIQIAAQLLDVSLTSDDAAKCIGCAPPFLGTSLHLWVFTFDERAYGGIALGRSYDSCDESLKLLDRIR
jgi:hypothetical protein